MNRLKLDEFYFEENSFIKSKMAEMNLEGLTAGKQLRSQLISLIGSIFEHSSEDLRKLGRIAEMVHNATLTHDDVIDNSHTRRGAPSMPTLVNNKKSVLLGDYMLARALHELSDFNNPTLTKELTLTLKDLVEGEWIQFENTNPYKVLTETYEALAIKKTGSLFRWCFVAPLVAKDQNSGLYKNYVNLGEELGVIFQMTDDIIDFNKESKKTYGLDFHNNNINFVLQILGENHPELEVELLAQDNIENVSEVAKLAITASVEKANQIIEDRITKCRNFLAEIEAKTALAHREKLQEVYSILELMQTRLF